MYNLYYTMHLLYWTRLELFCSEVLYLRFIAVSVLCTCVRMCIMQATFFFCTHARETIENSDGSHNGAKTDFFYRN